MTEPKQTNDAAEPIEPIEPVGAPCEPEADAGAAPDVTMAEVEAELAETKDRLLRALAETENQRRRATRDVEEAHKYAVTNFSRELLDVADNLSRALAAVPTRAREEIGFVKNLVDGVAMTEKALLACFERHQIAKVVPEIGERFDHNRHQAMFEVEAAGQEPGTVAQVMQPGYTIAERLLRPALVGVAKRPAVQPGAAQNGDAEEADAELDVAPGRRIDTTA
jgi:molecular chaperone GrpE